MANKTSDCVLPPGVVSSQVRLSSTAWTARRSSPRTRRWAARCRTADPRPSPVSPTWPRASSTGGRTSPRTKVHLTWVRTVQTFFSLSVYFPHIYITLSYCKRLLPFFFHIKCCDSKSFSPSLQSPEAADHQTLLCFCIFYEKFCCLVWCSVSSHQRLCLQTSPLHRLSVLAAFVCARLWPSSFYFISVVTIKAIIIYKAKLEPMTFWHFCL